MKLLLKEWVMVACVSGCQQETPDIREVEADLEAPASVDEEPAPGKRVRHVHPDYKETEVYHTLYLPGEWEKGSQRYPVLVEYAGNGPYKNKYDDESLGTVEGSCFGFGLSGGRRFIWVCLPYLSNDGKKTVTRWWGDAPENDPRPTVEYCKKVVPWICENYGGDPKSVILIGFSRGAIACNFIGLHDDEIAKLWKGFVPYSHYDGVWEKWGYPNADRQSATKRLKRLGQRPQFICHEASEDWANLEGTRKFIQSTGVQGDFTLRLTGFRNHSDEWVLRPSPVRKEIRQWLDQLLREEGR